MSAPLPREYNGFNTRRRGTEEVRKRSFELLEFFSFGPLYEIFAENSIGNFSKFRGDDIGAGLRNYREFFSSFLTAEKEDWGEIFAENFFEILRDDDESFFPEKASEKINKTCNDFDNNVAEKQTTLLTDGCIYFRLIDYRSKKNVGIRVIIFTKY